MTAGNASKAHEGTGAGRGTGAGGGGGGGALALDCFPGVAMMGEEVSRGGKGLPDGWPEWVG